MGTGAVKIYRLLASLLLPALAILAAAFAQHMLTEVWPGIREIRVPVVTVDGYFVVLCSGILCFLAAVVLRRHVGSRSGFVCAVIAPSAFLCFFLWATLGRPIVELGARIAWLRPITLFSIAAAMLPLAGLVMGWWYSGKVSSRPIAWR